MLKVNNKNILVCIVSLLLTLILPIITFAALVPCGNSDQPACNISYFIYMVNAIINGIIGIATVIFAISLIYGGFLYLTSGENPGNKEKAKSMLWRTLIGFVIILTAWVIVHTILNALVPEGSTIYEFIGTGGITY